MCLNKNIILRSKLECYLCIYRSLIYYSFVSNSLASDYVRWEFDKRQLLKSRGLSLEDGNKSEADKYLERITTEEEKYEENLIVVLVE